MDVDGHRYDWINIPLVYTQVVTLATYGYFGFSLVGRQNLIPRVAADGKAVNEVPSCPPVFIRNIDDTWTLEAAVELYFPLFTTLEFLFYIGWMKVQGPWR